MTEGTALAVALPSDAMQLMALARDISSSRLIPSHFQKSPADCWLLMSFCRNRGLDFFATVGHCHIVQQRLMFDGQLSTSLLNISGQLAERLSYEYERDENGVATAIIVSGRLISETTPRTVRVELNNVRTNNDVWKKQPEQQLAYSGSRTWGRRHLPEVLLGMIFEGETIDITPVVVETATITEPHKPLLSNTMTQDARSAVIDREAELKERVADAAQQIKEREQPLNDPLVDAGTGAIKPHAISRDGMKGWREWKDKLLGYITATTNAETINDWTTENFDHIAALQARDPELAKTMIEEINAQIELRVKGGDDSGGTG